MGSVVVWSYDPPTSSQSRSSTSVRATALGSSLAGPGVQTAPASGLGFRDAVDEVAADGSVAAEWRSVNAGAGRASAGRPHASRLRGHVQPMDL
jgi:hypothetical protein